MAPLFSLRNSSKQKIQSGKDGGPQPESLTAATSETRRSGWYLAILLLVAFALRFPGVVWELPGQLHFFSYHPDELPIIGAAVMVSPSDGQFNPNFYNYGTLYIYLIRLLMVFTGSDPASGIGLITMAGRLLSVFAALGTVWACYAGGRVLGGIAGGIAAGMFVAVTPIHVQQSQFLTVDSTATFFVSLALYMAIHTRPGWSGFYSGLAAATKYTAGIAIVAPLAMWAGGYLKDRKKLAKAAGVTIAAAAGGFLLGCPGAALWTGDFLRDFLFEVNHSRTGHGLVFEQTGPGWWYLVRTNMLAGFGWPFTLVALAATLWALIRRRLQTNAVLVFVGCLCFILATSEVRFARYLLLLVPAFSLLTAHMLSANQSAIKAYALAVLLTVAYTAVLQSPLSKLDPRTQAAGWIADNVEQGAVISFPSVPWFYSPPLTPMFGALSREQRRRSMELSESYTLVAPDEEWSDEALEHNPDYVVISSFEEDDRKRLNDKTHQQFMNAIKADFAEAESFGGDPPVSFFSLQKKLPHDMQYLSPRITIYERK